MEEMFDVLDEKGEFTNETATRSDCHKLGLWHKAVVVFVINSKNEVLLQKRSANKKLWPNLWDITAGGHVLSGEFGYQAVIREAKEEIGLVITKNDLTFIGASSSINIKDDIINKHFNEFYIVNKDVVLEDLILQTEEVSDIKWIPKEELINKIDNNYDTLTTKEGCWEYLKKYFEFTS